MPENGATTLDLLQHPVVTPESRAAIQKALIACGVLASLLYAAMVAFIPLAWNGYSSASRVVSELSAIDAPTRALWVPLGVLWAVLMTAFGWGVCQFTDNALRRVGALLFAYGLFNILPWPPMHQREVLAAGGGTLTDQMHIVWTCIAVSFMLGAMGFGAKALGRPFRLYSLTTIVVLLASGILTGMDSPRLSANLPTPLIGMWERISIGAFLLWIIVLSVALLRGHARFNPPPLATATREGGL